MEIHLYIYIKYTIDTSYHEDVKPPLTFITCICLEHVHFGKERHEGVRKQPEAKRRASSI